MDFDRPIFKWLSNNDTGAAAGHQGGIVIPAAIAKYFPLLVDEFSAVSPTVDCELQAELFVDGEYRGLAETRYQYQTWGGTRSPERRLTRNLGPLRNEARGGDLLLMFRAVDADDYYRLMLVRQGTPEFIRLTREIGSRRWGALDTAAPPLSTDDIKAAEEEETLRESAPFAIFDPAARRVERSSTMLARSRVFQRHVMEAYGGQCAVCGEGLMTPGNRKEVQAAHIVPRHLHGVDDVRNGLALCLRHHWSFDRGLFGFSTSRLVEIPPRVSSIGSNAPIAGLSGSRLREPARRHSSAASDALQWHLRNVVYREPPY